MMRDGEIPSTAETPVERQPADEGQVRELTLPGLERLPLEPKVSVIVPVTERPEPLADLYLEYSGPLLEADGTFEFIFAVEPWNRPLVEPLWGLARTGAPIRVVEAGHGVGESVLLKLGASIARGEVLLCLPAYRRVTAAALPALVRAVEAGADLATARRWPRRDSWLNRVQTRLFHALVSNVAGKRLQDVASGVRAMRPEVIREVPLYGDYFRFLPVLALREGFRVEELDADQHARDARVRVYGPGTYLRRLIDVLGLVFISRFTYKPLRFFGLIGSALGGIGGVILLVLFVQRIGGQGIADRPMLLLGVLLFTLGVQAIALGLIGEIIVHFNAPARRPYRVRDRNGSGEDRPSAGEPADPGRGRGTA